MGKTRGMNARDLLSTELDALRAREAELVAKQALAARERVAKRLQRVEDNVIEAVNTKGDDILEAIQHLQLTLSQKRPAQARGKAGSKRSRGPALLDFRAKDVFVQSELDGLFALREALEFSDVCRLHGRAVAASVWGKLSAMGRATYEDSTFQRMLRCRSTWELDRCTAEEISGCSDLERGELSKADFFRVCATRLCLNNAEILAEATAEGTLDMEHFDPEKLWGIVGQSKFSTGVRARAYTFLARKWGGGWGVKWGFCVYAREILIPALRDGLLDKLYKARDESLAKGLDGEATNRAVETLVWNELQVPPVLRCLILRDLGLLTRRCLRGSLYDLDHCWNVLSGAEEGLLGIVSVNDGPRRDSNERALKLLWTPYLEHRNLALATLLPRPHPPTLQHQCCEKRKFDQRGDRPGFVFPGERDPRPHLEGLRAYWSLIAPHAPALLSPEEAEVNLAFKDARVPPSRGGS